MVQVRSMGRLRAALRLFAIIVGTAFLTWTLLAYLTAFLFTCARAKEALQVP